MGTRSTAFEDLRDSDLVVDQIYRGGTAGNVKDDPLQHMLPVGNQGGFRTVGAPSKGSVRLVALYSTGNEIDWPDSLDETTGDFTYYGDNRSPGRALTDTQRGGNRLLEHIFEASRGGKADRIRVPPILLFQKAGRGRDVRFRGLLVPGGPTLTSDEELVAVWRSASGSRFQNYRAHFTVLDAPTITRSWLQQVLNGKPMGSARPRAWKQWVDSRTFRPLTAPPTVLVRSKADQLPSAAQEMKILMVIYKHFANDPHAFETFAADVWKRSDPNIAQVDVTRPWRDGGRDAVGSYVIGPKHGAVAVQFALEAKCFAPGRAGVGVRATSRLISRITYRQFGVLITTSYINPQAYAEIKEDRHPVVVVSGADLVGLLRNQGYSTAQHLAAHLSNAYPLKP